MYFSRRRMKTAAQHAGAGLDFHAQPYRPLPPAAIKQLQDGIHGRVVVPGTDAYDLGRQLFNPKFNKFPVVICYCISEHDIALALQVARENDVGFAIRSGGHCTEGWSASEGVLIDLSEFGFVMVDPSGEFAWASSGCDFQKINDALEPRGLHAPGGTCPDVCVGGYMQGGGYGFTARVYGMNCDVVDEFRMMLADGSIVRANASQNADLFWAVRGGMGGNYGILLWARYRLVKLDAVSAFSIGWWFDTPSGLDHAAAALVAMQRDMIRDPAFDRLGFQVAVAFQGDTPATSRPCVMMKAMVVGTAEEGERMQERIAKLAGAEVQYSVRGKYAALNEGLMTKPYEIPQLPIDAMPNESKEARYIDKPIPHKVWVELLEHFRRTPTPMTIYGIEMYGAQIARGPAEANSFAHRAADMDFFCDVFWFSDENRAAMEEHLAGWTRLVAPYWSGGVYPNYPTRSLADYRSAYWRDNFEGVLAVKQKYDPDNYFEFSQSLRPREGAVRAPSPGGPIVVER
jgi:FAD/FMN-containing dehydrogenase